MFAQGKAPHQGQRDALAYPEETAQEHHHRDGAQHADTQLIALRNVTLAQRRDQPRQAHGDQKSCHAAQHKAP
ncbi:hypothetical protein D3C81_2010880 [compost metagenome]